MQHLIAILFIKHLWISLLPAHFAMLNCYKELLFKINKSQDYILLDDSDKISELRLIIRNGNDDKIVNIIRSINYDFYVKSTEVTVWEWNYVMSDKSLSSCGMLCPKQSVSFVDAVLFANKLSKIKGLEECYVVKEGIAIDWPLGVQCKGYRLPTLVEWYYYAGGLTKELMREDIEGKAVLNSGGPSLVASKVKNKFGLYDVIGNVEEFVWDSYSFYPETEMRGDLVGGKVKYLSLDEVIIKGNSFFYRKNGRDVIKSSSIDHKEITYGFRLVRSR